MEVIIEPNSGFCFGVVSAIEKAQDVLKTTGKLYCLGEIVHNDSEIDRLGNLGLITVSKDEFKKLRNTAVLIRAHGEPPETYKIAKQNNIELIDATCPMVLALQRKVKKGYEEALKNNGQIVIFGKKGHAEVVGLTGQTDNTAIIISSVEEFRKKKAIDFNRPIYLYSQTTKNKEEYQELINSIQQHIPPALLQNFRVYQTICSQVANRAGLLLKFANQVDVLLFVSGVNSSNGQYLYQLCKKHKEATYFLSGIQDFDPKWVEGKTKIGISGATSTPMWLMKEIAEACTSIN